MPVYNRNADYPDKPANWWLDYRISPELQQLHALKSRRIREPGCGANRKQTERMLARRKREVETGTWKPPNLAAGVTFERLAHEWIARREADGVRTAKDEASRLTHHAVPVLGDKPITSITREHVRVLINDLAQGGELAPRTIHHVYRAIAGVLDSAVPSMLDANPCNLKVKPGELPAKTDKDPRWRSRAVFSHGEIIELATRDEVPVDRRTFWALLALTGCRFGEAAGLRVDDYDRHASPLGRLRVETQYDGRELKGGAPARDVPVHPFLAWMLDRWLADGFELVLGRRPRPTDHLVPSRRMAHRSLKHMEHKLEQDLERIGLRRRTPHDFRRAFISLAQADGGSAEVLRCVTHSGTGRGKVWDGYSQMPWSALCEHVAKLRMPIPGETQFRSHGAEIGGLQQESWRDGRDLKQPTGSGIAGNRAERKDQALAIYAEILGVPVDPGQPVTAAVSVDLTGDLGRAAEALRSGRQLERGERRRLAAAVEAACDLAAVAHPTPARAKETA